jgi:hypothetical protein
LPPPSAFPPQRRHFPASRQPTGRDTAFGSYTEMWRDVKHAGLAVCDWLKHLVIAKGSEDSVLSNYAKDNGSLSSFSYKTIDKSDYESVASEDVSPKANHQGNRAPSQRAVSLPRSTNSVVSLIHTRTQSTGNLRDTPRRQPSILRRYHRRPQSESVRGYVWRAGRLRPPLANKHHRRSFSAGTLLARRLPDDSTEGPIPHQNLPPKHRSTRANMPRCFKK